MRGVAGELGELALHQGVNDFCEPTGFIRFYTVYTAPSVRLSLMRCLAAKSKALITDCPIASRVSQVDGAAAQRSVLATLFEGSAGPCGGRGWGDYFAGLDWGGWVIREIGFGFGKREIMV